MPELPEVETIKNYLQQHILNISITSILIRQPNLRWRIPDNVKSDLFQQKIIQIQRRGKYLLFISHKGVLIVHLGMSGKLLILPKQHKPNIHEHFALTFANDKSLVFIDPRRFGAVLWADSSWQEHPLLRDLGPEPLNDEFTATYLFQLVQNRNIAAKQFIMDSHIVVGVGNIYANESLFLAKIHPERKVKTLSFDDCEKLVASIKTILQMAVAKGGTTIRDYVNSENKGGNFQHYLKVYGRGGKPCVMCNNLLIESRLGQRTTVYCSTCQV